MNDEADVVTLLQRVFRPGPIKRVPKKQHEAEIFMALSLVDMDPEGIFEETDINRHLSRWLESIAAQNGNADYVTLRRALVDHGFLRRASDGVIYRIRGERIDEVLTPAAKAVDPVAIFNEVQAARSQRRADHKS